MQARHLRLGLNVAGWGYVTAVGWVGPSNSPLRMVQVEFASDRRKRWLPDEEVVLIGDPESPMSPSGQSKRRMIIIGRLMERDGARCFYCRESLLEPWHYTLDHWIPRWRGGKSSLPNLRLACSPCNSAKGHLMPDEFAKRRPGEWVEESGLAA